MNDQNKIDELNQKYNELRGKIQLTEHFIEFPKKYIERTTEQINSTVSQANIDRFSTLIKFTAEHFKILPAFIEKDYWITRSLQRLYQNPNMEKVVFKGGTSLAKAYRLTNRFSEDILCKSLSVYQAGNHLFYNGLSHFYQS